MSSFVSKFTHVFFWAGLWMTSALITTVPANAQSAAAASALTELEDVDYWVNLCRLQADAGAFPEAIASCEQAIALAPENANIWAQHSGLLVSTEAFPEAIASADQALAFDPNHSLAIAYQCVAYSALGETETALDKCNNALRVNGSWGTENPALAWRYRGRLLAQAQQYEMALVAYERSLLLEPEDSLTLVQKCGVYVAMEKSYQALNTCQAALAENGYWGNNSGGQSGPALAWTYQGQAYGQLGRYDDAIAAYDQSIALDPTNALTWRSQGEVLDQLRRDTEALVSFEQAIALAPESSLSLLGQCRLLNRLENYEAALASCDAALAGDGIWVEEKGKHTLATAWNQRSVALAGAGQYEEALAAINRSVGIDPNDVTAHHHRSTIFWYLGQYAQALAANQQALAIEDDYAPAWFTRGVIFRALENYERALQAYDRGLSLNPLSAWAWTNRSVILWQMEDYEAALVSAERAIALNDESLSAWYNQGAALLSLGLYHRAIATYSKVLEMNEQYAAALTGRGIARLHLQDYAAASTDLQAALALNPEDKLAQETLTTLIQLNSAQS